MDAPPQTVSHYRVLGKLGRGGMGIVIDSQSRKTGEILSVAPNSVDTPTLSRDERLMYFSVVATEADIWLATIK